MAKLKSLLKSTNPNLLANDFHRSMKGIIEQEVAKNLDIATETLIKIVRHASHLKPIHIYDGREIVVDTAARKLESERRGEYMGHHAFAIVRYSGSSVFWRKKPANLNWSRHGVINSKSVKVRLYLDSLDPTEAYHDFLADFAPAQLAVREFHEIASDFNAQIEPKIPGFVAHWAGTFRDFYSRN